METQWRQNYEKFIYTSQHLEQRETSHQIYNSHIFELIIYSVKLKFTNLYRGLSWPRLYCSWIYNYLCNQCLSPLMLWVWISIRARCTTLCDKVCQWQVSGFLLVLRFPPPIKLTANWYIVESGIKHHQTNILIYKSTSGI